MTSTPPEVREETRTSKARAGHLRFAVLLLRSKVYFKTKMAIKIPAQAY